MILSLTAEYAFRAMARLAVQPDGEALRATDLSEATGIPPHYLSKIMRRLVAAGLLESERGHGGGFRLARPAEAIAFSDILAAVDAELDPTRCAFGWGRCNAKNPCLLHPLFSKLNGAVTDWASGSTLADVLAGAAPAADKRGRGPSKR